MKNIAIILLFVITPLINAQTDVVNFFKIGGDIFTAPFHFEKDDWTYLSVTALSTRAAFLLDKPVKSLFLRNKNSAADFIFEIDKYYYIEGAAAGITATYLYGAIGKDEQIKNLGLQLAEASFYASVITLLTKALLGRKRPDTNCGCISYNPFTIDIINSALPSAHSTLAFAFSTVMANYKNDMPLRITWYTLASLVGMARIYHNKHWFSDVVLGAAVGYFIGSFVTNHKTNRNETKLPPEVQPANKLISLKIPF